MKPGSYDDWYWENPLMGTGSLHDVKSWGHDSPLLISSRPIGFMADISIKPRYSVRAPTRKIGNYVKPDRK